MTVPTTTLTKNSRAIQRLLDQAPKADVEPFLRSGRFGKAWQGFTGKVDHTLRQQMDREAFLTNRLQSEHRRKNIYRTALLVGVPAVGLAAVGGVGLAWLNDPRDKSLLEQRRKTDELAARQRQVQPFEATVQPLPRDLPNTMPGQRRYLPDTLANRTVIDREGNRRQMPLYQTNNPRQWVAPDGTEYWVEQTPNGELRLLNEQRSNTRPGSLVVTPGPNAFTMSAPYADVERSRRYLAEQGLQVRGILSTGPIEPVQNYHSEFSKLDLSGVNWRPSGYHYFNPQALRGGAPGQPVEYDAKLGGAFSTTHGTYTTQDGRVRFLNVEGRSVEERNREIEALKRRPDVVSISLDAWPVPTDAAAPEFGSARAIRAFDREGTLLGYVNTPPIGYRDAWTVARDVYGDRLGSISALDNDFYSQFYLPGSPHSTDVPLGYRQAVLLVEPTGENDPAYQPPSDAVRRAQENEYRRERIRDLAGDLWDKINNRR